MPHTLGVIGLGVMGSNLALNISDNGFSVSVYNRTYQKTRDFLDGKEKTVGEMAGYEELKDFVNSLEKPRKILLMIQAGQATDEMIGQLVPLLEKGDILIDGGNAHWADTVRRERELKETWIHFIGSGVSGGETWARHGPSLMPGGDEKAYEAIRPIWEAISAKDFKGRPCTTLVGKSGAGHFVKMVHNGIEYAMMQGIAEIYDLLRSHGCSPENLGKIFKKLNSWPLESFLLEITVKICETHDPRNPDRYLIDALRDRAKSKGTGGWTVQSAIDLGVPVPTIAEALMARQLSARDWRFTLEGQQTERLEEKWEMDPEKIRQALTLIYLAAYLQWLDTIIHASREYDWGIDHEEVTRIWQWGCIIRSRMLETLPGYLKKWGDLRSMMETTSGLLKDARTPTPVIASAVNYFRSIYARALPTNLIQAQRDLFGAHTFEREDTPGEWVHHEW